VTGRKTTVMAEVAGVEKEDVTSYWMALTL